MDVADEADHNDNGDHIRQVPAVPINEHDDVESNATERSPLLNGRHERSPLHGLPDDEQSRMTAIAGFYVLKALTFAMTIISVVWLILLIVDLFVSIPSIEARDSGFLSLLLTAVTIFSVVLSLHGTPSIADFYMGFICAGLVLTDGLFILLIPNLRHRYGAGYKTKIITTFGGQTLLIFLSTITHRGHIFHSRDKPYLTFKRWLKLALSFVIRCALCLTLLLVTINILFETYDMVKNKPKGSFVPVDDGTLDIYIHCIDSTVDPTTNTTIIIEAGETPAHVFAQWVLESDIGTRVCYWDRPGIGYSDSVPSPVSAGGVADALSQALAAFPDTQDDDLLLISHGIGSIYSRIFAGRHAGRVKGLMLVDGLHEDRFIKQETTWLGIKYFARGIVSPLGLYQFRRVLPNVKGLKSRILPTSGYFRAKLQEQFAAKPLSRNELIAASNLLPSSVPLVIVSSGHQIDKVPGWSEEQRQLTELTDRNLAWEIMEGPHNLWQNDDSKTKLQQLLVHMMKYT